MIFPICLSSEDYECLNLLARGEHPESRISTENSRILRAVLNAAKTSSEPSASRNHVGLRDVVTLISLTDPTDQFVLSLVLPSEEDLDDDRVGLNKAVALAVLGRRLNERVSWYTPDTIRVMSIAGIKKAAKPCTA